MLRFGNIYNEIIETLLIHKSLKNVSDTYSLIYLCICTLKRRWIWRYAYHHISDS